MKRTIPALLTAVFVGGTLAAGMPTAAAADETARPRATFNLGKAIARAFFARPRVKTSKLDQINRVHYAATVYAHEGLSTTKHEVVSSHGLFFHVNLDRGDRKAKMGHSLAE